MKVLILIISFCLSFYNGIGKEKAEGSLPDLAIKWQPVENKYLGKEDALCTLEIINTGNTNLSLSGWKIYFNFIRTAKSQVTEKDIFVKHVNGDLFYLYPSAKFQGLKPKESIKIELIVNSALVIASDAPQGFYLVSDKNEIKVINDLQLLPAQNKEKLLRFKGDDEITAEQIFIRNEKIIDIPVEKLTKVFPTPEHYSEQSGSFSINSKSTICHENGLDSEAVLLQSELFKLSGFKLKILKIKSDNSINLKNDSSFNETYGLTISSNSIDISAGSKSGFFYAIQSLKTLIDPAYSTKKVKTILIPNVIIKDKPRFAYRGLMLDVARNFQPKEQILKVLDLMALYKLNTLHFHLNDDEGWRLEIPALPELTEVGSKRGHVFDNEINSLIPSYGSGPFINKSSGSGFYSRTEFIEILRYAAARHITVIPEIETPGHARAAIKAMNARYHRLVKEGKTEEAEKYLLQDFNDKSTYKSVQQWNDNVIDVSMPSVYSFLSLVTDEIISIYQQANAPLKTIHFGGDEVPNGVWEQSPSFLKLKAKDHSVKNTDDLWYYFFARVDSILKSRGMFLSGWEEIAMRKTLLDGNKKWIPNPDFSNKNFHVNVWNNLSGNEDLAYKLANSGYKVILSFVTNFYLDMAYHKRFEEPGFYWGGFTELDKPFSFIPLDYLKNQKNDRNGRPLAEKIISHAERLTDYGKDNIVGIQSLLWTETVKTTEDMEYLILPRLLALAEKAWAKSPDWSEEKDLIKASSNYNLSLSNFFNVLGKRELKRLDSYADGFKYRIPQPGLKSNGELVTANIQLPGFIIRYTKDGSTPTIKSPIYTAPIKNNDQLVFRTFNNIGRGSKTITLKD